MKKSVSGFDVARLVSELQELKGAYFDKAYQLSVSELIIRFNKPGEGKREFYVNFSGYLYLSTDSQPKPEQPSTFAMVLRKHLGNCRVEEIAQHEFDRIIVINLVKQQTYRLVLELFGEGNAVLIGNEGSEGDENRIINTLYQRSWSARILRPGHPYNFPPQQAVPFELSVDDMETIMRNAKRDLVRALAVDLNLGGIYAEEVCKRTGLDKSIKAAGLERAQVEALHYAVQELNRLLIESSEPVIIYDNDTPVDVVPFRLQIYESNRAVPVPDLSSGLMTYFTMEGRVEPTQVSEAARRLEEELGRLERQLDQQTQAIEKFRDRSIERKELGDLIYQHYQLCESVLNKITELRNKYDWDEILEEEYLDIDEVEELNPHEGYVKVRLEKEGGGHAVVQLDIRLDVNRNAERYYETGKSAREKLEGAETAIVKTEEAIKQIRGSIASSVVEGEVLEERMDKGAKRKKFWFEKYKWFISSDGFLVVAGSDASSNEKVVKRYLRDGDRYVHADLHGAPSAVVRKKENSDEPISETALEEACSFALAHSKAWSAGLGAAAAYWVNADQVSKTPSAGEFVGKGAFIVRGKRNYAPKSEIQIAIGEVEWEGVRLLMCAPITSISSRTDKYLVLKPGKTKKTTMAKKLSKIFGYSIDEIMHLLPPGDMDIIESAGIEIE